MQTAPFTVMDASAGSGKTRNLVKAVLLQALALKSPEHALKPAMAITFTNSAAAEMKGRLLEYLIDFASATPKETGLLEEISAEISCPIDELKKRSKRLLKYILHHYNDLSFGTIDSFTSRIVRTFAKDLALAENFEIILDLNKLLAETTDLVISQAGQDPKLTQTLVAFVEQKLADEKSWSIDSALFDMARKLLEERHREPLSRLRDFTPDDFLEMRKKLSDKRRKLLATLENMGAAALKLIEENNIDPSSFSYGRNGISSYFNKCLNQQIAEATKVNYRAHYLDKGNWYAAKTSEDEKAKIDGIKDTLHDMTIAMEMYALENAPFVLLAEKIIQNTYSLATLSALDQALHSIEEAQNILPLAAFNHIVNAKVKDEPAPFIFERLGERYKHFYIDEFQDTSKMQWENIFPLIENGLASIGTALIVGDAKQSIYRWRNGEAEQFIELSQKAGTGEITPAIRGRINPLAENWRSRAQIVHFNNALFTSAAENIATAGYQDLYKAAAQLPRKAEGGFVEVKTFPTENFADDTLKYTLAQITAVLADGFSLGDIALLVRSNKDGATLVRELSTRGIPVISGDSLLLGNSYEGKLLSGLIALRTAPKNKTYRWALAEGLLQTKKLKLAESDFTFAFNLVNCQSPANELEAHFPDLKKVLAAPTDLYTYIRQMCLLFNLDAESNAFTEAFLQAIHDFVEKENGTGHEFVSWWEEKGFKIAISAPEQIDAIKVATIHKSKGLQYPVVMVPFVKWKLNENSREAWVNLDPEAFEGLSEMLLSVSKSNAEIIGGHYQELYTQLEDQEKFDSLNMLYVACTRAVERLYLCGLDSPGKTDIFKVVADFLAASVNNKVDENTFCWGEKQSPLAGKKETNEYAFKPIKTSGWQSKVHIAENAPTGWEHDVRDARSWGNKVHYILARIKTAADAGLVLQQLQNQGTFALEEIAHLATLISDVVTHDLLKESFAPGVIVYNERDILLPNQTRKRPDRVTKLIDGNVTLIDYKTGEREAKHKKQLEEYAFLLREAGLRVAKAFLVYINKELAVEAIGIER